MTYKAIDSVIHDYPAYRVVARKKNSAGFIELEFGDIIIGNGGSGVVSSVFDSEYAADSPIDSYHKAISLGHEIYYIIEMSSSIHSGAHEKGRDRLEADYDAIYLFKGRLFKIEKAANNNMRMVELEEES